MTRNLKLLILAVGMTALISPAASATEWDHMVNYIRGDITEAHPSSLTRMVTVPTSTADTFNLCGGYAHTFSQANKGSVRLKITIKRFDPDTGEESIEKRGKKGRVEANSWVRCVNIEKVYKGDIIVFEWTFKGMPKPRGGAFQTLMRINDSRLRTSALDFETETETDLILNSMRRNFEGKHLGSLSQTVTIHRATTDPVKLCAGYGNESENVDKGEITVEMEITRTDPDTGEAIIQTKTRSGEVKNNRYVGCANVKGLEKDDIVSYKWTFTKMPRGQGEKFQALMRVHPERLPLDWLLAKPVPPPPVDTGGGGGGGGDTGGGDTGGGDTGGGDTGGDPGGGSSAGITAADQRAISSLSKDVAVSIGIRDRGGKRTYLIGHRWPCANLMEASTMAGVYNIYVRACGRPRPGSLLTSSQLSAIIKLSKMKHTSAIRWESGGRVIGEYWSPATGTRKKTTNSIEAAVNWLVSEGRL